MAKKKERGKLYRAKEYAQEKYDDAKEYTQEKYDDAKDRTEEIIQEKPFTSVAIAAGVGAIVGSVVALGVAALVGRREKSFSEKLRDLF